MPVNPGDMTRPPCEEQTLGSGCATSAGAVLEELQKLCPQFCSHTCNASLVVPSQGFSSLPCVPSSAFSTAPTFILGCQVLEIKGFYSVSLLTSSLTSPSCNLVLRLGQLRGWSWVGAGSSEMEGKEMSYDPPQG